MEDSKHNIDNADNHFPLLSRDTTVPGDPDEKVKAKGIRAWRSKLKVKEFRRKVLRTLWLCFAYLALGISNAQRGPAIMDLQIITNTDIEKASAFFTAGSAGFVTGSLIGGLIYDLLSKSLSLICGLVGMAILTAATPYCTQFGVMLAVIALSSVFEGSVDTGGNADVVRLWGSEGGMAMQAIHFFFALGGVIAPVITEPFLTPRADDVYVNMTSSNDVHLKVNSLRNGSVRSYTDVGFLTDSQLGLLSNFTLSNYTDTTNSNQNGNPFTPTAPSTQLSGVRHGAKWEYSANLSPSNSNTNSPRNLNSQLWNTSTFLNNLTVSSLHGNSTGTNAASLDTQVHYAFIICGIFTFFPAIPLTAGYISHKVLGRQRKTLKKKDDNNSVHEGDDTQELENGQDVVKMKGNEDKKKNTKTGTKNDDTVKEGNSNSQNKIKSCGKNFENKDQKLENECRVENGKNDLKEKYTVNGLPLVVYICLLVWVCVFFMLYSTIEDTVANYLSTFVVMQLDWSKSEGALLTSVFWGSFAATRFVWIWVSGVVTSERLLTSCCVLMTLSFTGFLLASLLALHPAVWVITGVTGSAMSAIFPGAFSWMEEELLTVTGRITSVIMLASSLGLIISPMVLGHLLESRGAIWLAYVLLGEAAACLLTFLLLLLFARTRLRALRHNARHQHVVTIDVVVDDLQKEALVTSTLDSKMDTNG